MHRKQTEFHLIDQFQFYHLTVWKDIEEYSIFVEDREFKIRYKENTDDKNAQTLIWDAGQLEHELNLNEIHVVQLGNQKQLKIETGERTTSLIKLEY